MAKFPNHIFGTVRQIGAEITERDAASFTITSATATIKHASTGATVRSNTACTADNTLKRVYLQETFNATTGYTEGGSYRATFKVVMSDGSVEKYEGTFTVLPANDE